MFNKIVLVSFILAAVGVSAAPINVGARFSETDDLASHLGLDKLEHLQARDPLLRSNAIRRPSSPFSSFGRLQTWDEAGQSNAGLSRKGAISRTNRYLPLLPTTGPLSIASGSFNGMFSREPEPELPLGDLASTVSSTGSDLEVSNELPKREIHQPEPSFIDDLD